MRNDSFEVYRDGRFVLGAENGTPYLLAEGKRYTLSCYPYEPCLDIRDGNGTLTVVHNAFDPDGVLDAFRDGRTVTSLTGLVYTARDFCRMVEYAAGSVDIGIDDAERVFGGGRNKTESSPHGGGTSPLTVTDENAEPGRYPDDPFRALIAEYPDCVADWCIVKDDRPYSRYESHRRALLYASRKLFTDGGEVIWRYDVGKAAGKPVGAAALFAPEAGNGMMNYRKAFLRTPHGIVYTDKDFDRVNAALFPNGTDALAVYQWTTDWSEYFDDGREWWGALCLTVYDETLDRFVVILASATD